MSPLSCWFCCGDSFLFMVFLKVPLVDEDMHHLSGAVSLVSSCLLKVLIVSLWSFQICFVSLPSRILLSGDTLCQETGKGMFISSFKMCICLLLLTDPVPIRPNYAGLSCGSDNCVCLSNSGLCPWTPALIKTKQRCTVSENRKKDDHVWRGKAAKNFCLTHYRCLQEWNRSSVIESLIYQDMLRFLLAVFMHNLRQLVHFFLEIYYIDNEVIFFILY